MRKQAYEPWGEIVDVEIVDVEIVDVEIAMQTRCPDSCYISHTCYESLTLLDATQHRELASS